MSMNKDELLNFQRKSVALVDEDISYHQKLYNLTKHSKKKAKHLSNLRFSLDVKQMMYDEYGW